jgi:IPT/TIG domain
VGSSVTLNGVSLTQTSNVVIGGKSASFKVVSDQEVTATVPAGAKTGEKITITTAGGIATSSKAFAVVPNVISFSPTSGPVGTPVKISGTTFTGTTKVTFGGVAATSFEVIDDSHVDATVPEGAKTGKIAVTTPGGTGTSTTNFTVTK